jgi:hypothetical protein
MTCTIEKRTRNRKFSVYICTISMNKISLIWSFSKVCETLCKSSVWLSEQVFQRERKTLYFNRHCVSSDSQSFVFHLKKIITCILFTICLYSWMFFPTITFNKEKKSINKKEKRQHSMACTLFHKEIGERIVMEANLVYYVLFLDNSKVKSTHSFLLIVH